MSVFIRHLLQRTQQRSTSSPCFLRPLIPGCLRRTEQSSITLSVDPLIAGSTPLLRLPSPRR